jgi:hypothetical protein
VFILSHDEITSNAGGTWYFGILFIDFLTPLYLETVSTFLCFCRFLVLTINHAAMRTAVLRLFIPWLY